MLKYMEMPGVEPGPAWASARHVSSHAACTPEAPVSKLHNDKARKGGGGGESGRAATSTLVLTDDGTGSGHGVVAAAPAARAGLQKPRAGHCARRAGGLAEAQGPHCPHP